MIKKSLLKIIELSLPGVAGLPTLYLNFLYQNNPGTKNPGTNCANVILRKLIVLLRIEA